MALRDFSNYFFSANDFSSQDSSFAATSKSFIWISHDFNICSCTFSKQVLNQFEYGKMITCPL